MKNGLQVLEEQPKEQNPTVNIKKNLHLVMMLLNPPKIFLQMNLVNLQKDKQKLNQMK